MAVDWGQMLQLGLSMAGNYAANRQQGRQNAATFAQTQNQQAMQQNAQQNQILMQMAQIELLRKQMQEANRPQRAQQTALGDALANVRDVEIDAPSHITKFNVSGGLRPSLLGPNARAAGQELSGQALAALMEGDQFMPINPRGPVDLNAGMPGPESTFDKIMGFAGAAGNAWQGYQQQQLMQRLMQPGTPQAVNGGTNVDYAEALRRFGNMGGFNG